MLAKWQKADRQTGQGSRFCDEPGAARSLRDKSTLLVLLEISEQPLREQISR